MKPSKIDMGEEDGWPKIEREVTQLKIVIKKIEVSVWLKIAVDSVLGAGTNILLFFRPARKKIKNFRRPLFIKLPFVLLGEVIYVSPFCFYYILHSKRIEKYCLAVHLQITRLNKISGFHWGKLLLSLIHISEPTRPY